MCTKIAFRTIRVHRLWIPAHGADLERHDNGVEPLSPSRLFFSFLNQRKRKKESSSFPNVLRNSGSLIRVESCIVRPSPAMHQPLTGPILGGILAGLVLFYSVYLLMRLYLQRRDKQQRLNDPELALRAKQGLPVADSSKKPQVVAVEKSEYPTSPKAPESSPEKEEISDAPSHPSSAPAPSS